MSYESESAITRRDFAKAAAAGLAVLGAARSSQAAKGKRPLKVGLLGCGNRGTGAAIDMLTGNDNLKLVAMADVFEDRLKSSADKIKNHSNEQVRNGFAVKNSHCFVGLKAYKEILDTNIDIVIEGSLPYIRSKHIEAAVNKKKHIFTEKPVAVDPVGIRRVIAAAQKAKEKGLSIVAGTQRRHQQEYVETIKKIHDGAIGEILALRVYWCGGLPFAFDRDPKWSDLEYCLRNWYNYYWVSGDNIVEQHVHNLDVANWVMNDHPINVFASGGRTWKPRIEKYGDLYDNFSCDYEYKNGVHVTSFSRHWHKPCEGGVFEEAVGTKGRSACNDMGTKGINPYVQEHIDLVNSVCGAGPYYNEGVQVAESTLTAIMGRMSAYTGKKLTWDEALNSDLSLVPDDLSFDKSYPLGPVPSPGAPEKA
ncbi:MAG: Gfo/Idh/MocA family oxidoreductase [Candidatus Hydrogenedentes bacterium]|nr:Gfo/Idh/MocA family oxidoreductase [Candidatus Hydrogenedentota bacterium]